MFFKFLSLARPDFGYCWTSNHDYRVAGRILSDYAQEFQTYGDGLTQHSPEYKVQAENFTDYCMSLASFLIGLKGAEECSQIMEHLRFYFPWEPLSNNDIEFLYKLRYDENKVRYYNMRERKVSSAPAKQYDKRWTKVPDAANGTVPGMIGMLHGDGYNFGHLLRSFREYLDAYNYVMQQKDKWSPSPEKLLDMEENGSTTAFESVCAIVRAWADVNWATHVVEHYQERLKRKEGKTQDETKAEDAISTPAE